MSQDHSRAVEQPQSPKAGDDSDTDLSSQLETFGAGVTICILTGASIGVAAMWFLDSNSALPLLIGLGGGFMISPLLGILLLRV